MSTFNQEIIEAFDRTYQAIGFDLGGFENENHTIDRDDLFDICLDHLRTYGELSEDTLLNWEFLTFDEKIAYKTIVFKYEEYEVGSY